MRREDDTETESGDDGDTESVDSGKLRIIGLPLYLLSFKRLPKKLIKFSFLALNGSTFVSMRDNNAMQMLKALRLY